VNQCSCVTKCDFCKERLPVAIIEVGEFLHIVQMPFP